MTKVTNVFGTDSNCIGLQLVKIAVINTMRFGVLVIHFILKIFQIKKEDIITTI